MGEESKGGERGRWGLKGEGTRTNFGGKKKRERGGGEGGLWIGQKKEERNAGMAGVYVCM